MNDALRAALLEKARREKARRSKARETNIVEQGLNGANEGLANLFGFPVDATTAVLNAGVRGLNRVAGSGVPEIQNPVGGSASIQNLLKSTNSITEKTPQTRGQRYARRVGQEVAFGAPIAAATGGAASSVSLGRLLLNNLAADTAAGVAGQSAREVAPNSALADMLATTVAGGGVAALRGASLKSRPETPQATTEEMLEAAGQAYERAQNSGVQLNRAAQEALFDRLQARLKTERASPRRHPRAFDAVEAAKKWPNALLPDIEETRSIIARDVAGNKDEARVGVALKQEIDDYLNSITSSQTVGADPVQAISDLQEGRRLSHQAHKARAIEAQEYRAETRAASSGTGGNQVNATRQNIRSILDNEVAPRRSGVRHGYTPDEIAQMERIVLGTRGQNVLRGISRFAPSASGLALSLSSGAGAAGVAAGLTTGNPLALALAAPPILAEGAKNLAERGTRLEIEELMDVIRRGGKAVPKRQTDTGRAVQAVGGLSALGGLVPTHNR